MLPAVAWADALTVTVIGVASPQDVAGGKAELRAYALDSARDAALPHCGMLNLKCHKNKTNTGTRVA